MADVPGRVRQPADDETDPIGPVGQPEWRCAVTLAGGHDLTEWIHVRAATYDGAIKLIEEIRLNTRMINAQEWRTK
jgi:hypothetical protein